MLRKLALALAFTSLIALPTPGMAGHGGGGRYWRGRYWAYGVGPCWNWNPFFGGWAWVCY